VDTAEHVKRAQAGGRAQDVAVTVQEILERLRAIAAARDKFCHILHPQSKEVFGRNSVIVVVQWVTVDITVVMTLLGVVIIEIIIFTVIMLFFCLVDVKRQRDRHLSHKIDFFVVPVPGTFCTVWRTAFFIPASRQRHASFCWAVPMIELLTSTRLTKSLLVLVPHRRIEVERWRPPEDHCSNDVRNVGAHSTVGADPEDEPVKCRPHLETAHKALHEHNGTQRHGPQYTQCQKELSAT
jgi:hypothetical protein